jgi:hypothetical protein
MQTQNLPVFQTELVDGGLQVNVSTITGDIIVLLGFQANNAATLNTPASGYLDQTLYNTIRITKGDEAEAIYGLASDNSTLTQAAYEVLGAGGTTVFCWNLGPWGSATYVDPSTDVAYPVFNGPDASGIYTINKNNYYKALGYSYDLLQDKKLDIIVPVDAYAFDTVVPVSGRPTNFAYQLAQFCYDASTQNGECFGVINTAPASGATLQAVSTYVGTLPTWAYTITDGVGAITANGTGLLGIEYMAGGSGNQIKLDINSNYTTNPASTSILPGFFEANFDDTDTKYGLPPTATTEILLDRKNNRVDIGKYIDIIAEEPIYSNGAFTTDNGPSTYLGKGATGYAGLVSTLVPHSAPTNKAVSGINTLRYRKSLRQLDALAGLGYITFRNTTSGIVVSDAPTAARPQSDYRRRMTCRTVGAVKKMVGLVAQPFLGEANNDGTKNALNTAVKSQLGKFVKTGALRAYDFKITSSNTDMVLGIINIELTLVPALEVRKIKCVISLTSALS